MSVTAPTKSTSRPPARSTNRSRRRQVWNCAPSMDNTTRASALVCPSAAIRRVPVCMKSTSMPVRRLQVPRHRATTAHLCSAVPLPGRGRPRRAAASTSARMCLPAAELLRTTLSQAYADGLLTNPNVIVAGEVGMGKSTAIKTFVYRAGRHLRPVGRDRRPKGEYGPLADSLGLAGSNCTGAGRPGSIRSILGLRGRLTRRTSWHVARASCWLRFSGRFCKGICNPLRTPF